MNILVVDDDPTVLILAEAILQNLCGPADSISLASDGKVAQEMICSSSYDLIISDYQMPELDGLGLLRWVRDRNLILPFVIITSASDPVIRETAEHFNVSCFYYKPASPALLRSIVADFKKKLELMSA